MHTCKYIVIRVTDSDCHLVGVKSSTSHLYIDNVMKH